MMEVYTLEQSGQWDQAVRSFASYDVYWLSSYVKAFQIHGDGEPLFFYYEDGDVRGINVVMKRDAAEDERFKGKIPEGKYFDFATPYGYGGWLIEGTDTGKLFRCYEGWCRKNGIVSEFVRFHPLVGNHEAVKPYYEVTLLGEVVAVDLSSPEAIWRNFSSTCRNRIRKSMKSNVRIFHGRYPEIYKIFREIYNQTMEKDQASDYYYFEPSFYESLLMDLPDHAQVFYAQIPDGTVIAAAIMLMANGMMNYHLGGSLREYSSMAPMNQMFYRAALWGCANGCRTLYLGGGVGSGDDSLLRFKRTFYRGELNHFHVGKKIYDDEKYKELVAIRGNSIANRGYFPIYRG